MPWPRVARRCSGVAKTLLVRALAAALQLEFKRVQFTPDLMPGDVTGSLIYDARTAAFVFRAGPVFTNLMLADEINRTPPKTQAALLEAMEERQVSVDGEPKSLPDPFIVAATQNPIEYEGTYQLPEAQLDRFLLKLNVPVPPRDSEIAILGGTRMGSTRATCRRSGRWPGRTNWPLAAMRCVTSWWPRRCWVTSSTSLRPPAAPRPAPRCFASRRHRAAGRCRAWSWLSGRNYVTPDDVKAMARPTLRHRVSLRPEAELEGATPDGVLDGILASVPVPASDPDRTHRAGGVDGRAGDHGIALACNVFRCAADGAGRGGGDRRRVGGQPKAVRFDRFGAASARLGESVDAGWCSATTGAAFPRTRSGRLGAERACATARAHRRAGSRSDPTHRHPPATGPPRHTAIGWRHRALDRALGLAGRQRSQPVSGQIRILPPFISRKHLPSRLAKLRDIEGQLPTLTRGHGTEFDSLREYVVGDDVRSIDWRATARRADVVVRTWRPERDRASSSCSTPDAPRRAASVRPDRPRPSGWPRLDWSIDAALLLAALASGRRPRRLPRPRPAGQGRGVRGVTHRSACPAGRRGRPLEPALLESDWHAMVSAILLRPDGVRWWCC
ncbi:AAA domain family protein [Mycobacterium xenopi 4042]|uniref:AAA domain family protein n=1 Tax=Mycobacterium xenopi 4042 TaxID=1299334 RepID=X8EEJ4_MYCXE|nr:AAA domain family protein [Mycobacterium xenopi 4042]